MKLSLRPLIAIPLIGQVVVITALTGWLSYRNNQKAIQQLAYQILNETGKHVEHKLTDYTKIPTLITQENLDSLELQQLDPTNLKSWFPHLYRQIQRFPDVNYIYYGTTQGQYVEINRLPDRSLELALKDVASGGLVDIYAISHDGRLLSPLLKRPYDPRERPWYRTALDNQAVRWTRVYDFNDPSPTFGISFVHPYINSDGEFEGVLGADFTLRALETFITQDPPSDSSIAFVMEPTGKILASSEGTSSFKKSRGLSATALSERDKEQNIVVSTAVDHILKQFDNRDYLEDEQQFTFRISKENYWVQLTPFSDSYGLRWLGVSLIPESDFTQQLQIHNRQTLLLCLLAVTVSTGTSLIIARLIAQPIEYLGAATQEIARSLAPQCILPSAICEFNLLIDSFNQMETNLAESRAQLKAYSQGLEALVNQRTQALQQSQAIFAKIFQASPNAIALSTLDEGRYIKVNDRFVELVSLPRKDIINRTNTELNAWVAPQTRDVFRRELESGRLRNQEWSLRKTSGEIKTVLLSAEIVHFQTETCILTIANDIGERIAAREQLRQSEERWQLALKGNNDGIWDWNISTGEIFYSSRWKSMLGYRHDEVENQKCEWESRLHPEDRNRVLAATQAHLNQQTPFFSEEYRLRCKDGTYKWILDRGQALWDDDGRPIRMAGSHTDISDHKQIEENLRRSQTSLANAQRIAHVGNWEIDLRTHTGYWSPELLRMFGFEADGPTPSYGEVFRRIHPDERAAWKKQFRYALDTGEPQDTDFSIVLPTGDIRHIEGRVEGSQDSNGRVTYVFGTALDITDRKQAEATIQQQEQFLRSIYNSVDTGIFVVDVLGYKQFRYIDSNATVERMSGASRNTLINSTPEELFDADTAVEVINKYQHCVDYGELLTFEEKLLIHNQWNWWLTTLTPLRNDEGRIYRIIGTTFNISQRKTIEEELAQQIQSEQLLTSISNQVRQSLNTQKTYQTTVDQIGLAFGSSRCCLHIYGETPTPHITTVAEYLIPDYDSRLNAQVPISNNPHIQTVLSQDLALITDDVTEEPLLQTVRPLWDSLQIQSMMTIRTSYQGKPNGVIEVHQCDRKRIWLPWEIDLLESVAAQVGIAIAQARLLEQESTQREELALKNAALETAKQTAERASQVKGEFLANMSHELRTPLNAILGFAQIMQRTLKYDPKRFPQESAEHLQIIQNSGDHLLTLINDVLDMAKIETGHVTINTQPFNLHKLLHSLEVMFQPKAQEKGLVLDIECGPEVPQYVETDEAKLRQILINLMGNAVKFTHTGRVAVRVRGEQQIQFAVEDTGLGIAPDQLKHLFEAFYQTDAGRQSQSGTGLGLAISKTYANYLNGTLSVDSTLGKGSTFQLTLPVGPIHHLDEHETTASLSVVCLAPNQPSYRILVVEDKWASRTLLVKLLEPVGFEVREAANGQEAIQIWEEWQPHMIWMDMQMPVMNGYEATQHIRAHVRGQATAIIALTASALESDKQIILSAGCDDFVRKPFQDSIIFDKLHQYLGVNYIYEQETGPAVSASDSLKTATPEQLSQQPTEWLQQLHSASSLADAEWVSQLIDQLPPAHDRLAAALRSLVKGFRCDLIAKLCELSIQQNKS